MKKINMLLVCFMALISASSWATNLYLLNKTGEKVYYEYLYFPAWKALGNELTHDGILYPDEVKLLTSYRFSAVRLRPDRFAQGSSYISSFKGDRRIFKFCKANECKGTMLKSLGAQLRNGQIEGEQGIFHSKLAWPVVLVITLKEGTTAEKPQYIITELSSNKDGKVEFLNYLRGLPTENFR